MSPAASTFTLHVTLHPIKRLAILAQAISFEIVVKQCDFQREHFVFVWLLVF